MNFKGLGLEGKMNQDMGEISAMQFKSNAVDSKELNQLIDALCSIMDQWMVLMKHSYATPHVLQVEEINEYNQKNIILIEQMQQLILKIQTISTYTPHGSQHHSLVTYDDAEVNGNEYAKHDTLIDHLQKISASCPLADQHTIKKKLQQLSNSIKMSYRTLLLNTNVVQHNLDWLRDLFGGLDQSKQQATHIYDKAGKTC